MWTELGCFRKIYEPCEFILVFPKKGFPFDHVLLILLYYSFVHPMLDNLVWNFFFTAPTLMNLIFVVLLRFHKHISYMHTPRPRTGISAFPARISNPRHVAYYGFYFKLPVSHSFVTNYRCTTKSIEIKTLRLTDYKIPENFSFYTFYPFYNLTQKQVSRQYTIIVRVHPSHKQ